MTYHTKRAAWLIAKIKGYYPSVKTSDCIIITCGRLVEMVKAKLNEHETVNCDGLSMEVYDNRTDDITPIFGY